MGDVADDAWDAAFNYQCNLDATREERERLIREGWTMHSPWYFTKGDDEYYLEP